MSKRDDRWTEQDVALVKARRQLATAVKTQPIDATTGRTYTFCVPGIAQPGGSKNAFVPLHPKTKQPYKRTNGSIIANVVDANPKVGKWRKHVARVAHEEYAGPLFDGALEVTFIFYRPRPACHYNSSGALSKEGRETPFPIVAPDTTKLVRATEDALQGVCWLNDAIIVRQHAWKEYGTPPRVEITIEELIPAAVHDQTSLFETLEPPPPWETKDSADARQKASDGRPGLVSGVIDPKDTCDGGTGHSDQSDEPIEPAPWEAQEQTTVKKKSRGKVIA